jgi:hypothetical protein
MLIDFRIIAHREQRYPTVGDYFRKDGRFHFRVSRMKGAYPVLVFLHEIVEFFICRQQGVKLRDIDRFDRDYEKARDSGRAPCGCTIEEEPGDDPHAPYFDAHQTATQCERAIAKCLRVDWNEYEKAVRSL